MPYTNDMQSLADIVGPAYAAQQAGIQQDQATQEGELKNQQSAAMNPLIQQEQQNKNDEAQQQTKYYGALTGNQNLKNNLETATQPGQIAATNSANGLKVTSDNVQKVQTYGQFATQLAPVLEQTPPLQRAAVAAAAMQKAGIDPEVAAPYLGEDPNDMPNRLRTIGQQMVQQSGKYISDMAETGLKEEGANQRTAMTSQTELQKTQMQQDTAKYKIERTNQIKQLMATTDQKISQISTQIAQSKQAGQNPDPALVSQLKFLSDQKVAQANALNAELVGGGQVTTPSERTGGNVAAFAGSGGAPSGPPVGGVDAVSKAVTASGIPYEPEKYDYRIAPGGQVQRKPKQGT
jgi:hypothetical protein